MQISKVAYPSGALMMHGHLVRPSTTGRLPAVIIVHEWWGLNDHMASVAERLAQEGFVVFAPDLYSRFGYRVAKDAAEAAMLMSRLRPMEVVNDLLASIEFLKHQEGINPKKFGVLGFAMGGTFALLLAMHSADLKTAVVFYGQVPPAQELLRLRCPTLYIAAGQDHWITKEELQRLQEALSRIRNAGYVQTYLDVPHAFFNDTRPDVHRPAAAAEAWRHTLQFFRRHLS